MRYLERVFCRACLESPVAIPALPRQSSTAAATWSPKHTALHQLKRRLLHAALESTADEHLFKRLSGAANEAADVAWGTDFPLLVLPCLFEEMVQQIRGPGGISQP